MLILHFIDHTPNKCQSIDSVTRKSLSAMYYTKIVHTESTVHNYCNYLIVSIVQRVFLLLYGLVACGKLEVLSLKQYNFLRFDYWS